MQQPDKRAIAEINLSNLESNIKEIKSIIGPKVKFMAVVKADAYGHGAAKVARSIEKNADILSVASLAEAVELKAAGVKKPILILSEVTKEAAGHVIKNGFIQTVYTLDLAKKLSAEAKKQKKNAKVHFKVDTGMGRIGASINEAEEIYRKIISLPNVRVDGIFTHLAKAEEQNGFTGTQITRFKGFLEKIDTSGKILHCANSAGAIYHENARMDMVRIGLSMYGLYPPGGKRDYIKLKPALQFKTRIMYIKRVPPGAAISYGSTFITEKETNIATLPVGYADGLPRLLSNKGQVLINGKRYPMVGRICMDMTMVDLGDDNAGAGDEVTLIGTQGQETISADDIASLAQTISYEIICGIGKRVPRIYIKGERST